MTCENCVYFYKCLQEATELGQVFFPDSPSHACDEFKWDKEEYIPSSTNRDYGPSNPWDAPGCSIKDFI